MSNQTPCCEKCYEFMSKRCAYPTCPCHEKDSTKSWEVNLQAEPVGDVIFNGEVYAKKSSLLQELIVELRSIKGHACGDGFCEANEEIDQAISTIEGRIK